MLNHIVLFQLKPDVTTQQRADIITALTDLQRYIPEILEISSGENFADRNGGFDLALFVRLKDRDALQTYRDHPEHRRVVSEFIQPAAEKIIAADYEY